MADPEVNSAPETSLGEEEIATGQRPVTAPVVSAPRVVATRLLGRWNSHGNGTMVFRIPATGGQFCALLVITKCGRDGIRGQAGTAAPMEAKSDATYGSGRA